MYPSYCMSFFGIYRSFRFRWCRFINRLGIPTAVKTEIPSPGYEARPFASIKRLDRYTDVTQSNEDHGSPRELSEDWAPKDSANIAAASEASKESLGGGRSSSPLRRFRSLQALHLKPLKRKTTYGVPACDLQLRSYSIRNIEFFADFALRAAYYLGLPASGPTPLPRIIERWTVPRSNFIFKKSQENYERITMRRLIQIQDGHPEPMKVWLAFLKKYQYYGIGMKANVWRFEELGRCAVLSFSPINYLSMS